MDDAIFASVSERPFELVPTFNEVPGRYEGSRIPLHGKVSLRLTVDSIAASIVDDDNWAIRMMQSSPTAILPFGFGGLFREVDPGLLTASTAGVIVPDCGGWEARNVLNCGTHSEFPSNASRYDFNVGALILLGPAFGAPVSVSRHVFVGGGWSASSAFNGGRLRVQHLSSGERREEEMLSAAVDGELDDVTADALWLLLSFVTGNRLKSVAVEKYSDDGSLIQAQHRRGGDISIGRSELFHRLHAPLSSRGLETVGSGMLRLMKAQVPFPIEIVVHHFLDANTGYLETDAQHRVLAIHTAIEAWNRKYGIAEWIDDDIWEPFSASSRRTVFGPIRDTVGTEMRANLASAYRHANRTSTSYRQKALFDALEFNLENDEQRALKMRDELLHNGYFLLRWHQLSPEERQARRDGNELLRRLAVLIILRLCAFEGVILDSVRFMAFPVERVCLPDDIAPPEQTCAAGSV